MRFVFLMICIAAAPLRPLSAADDWIGLEDEAPVFVGIDLGQDEAGDDSGSLMLSLPIGLDAGFDGYYSYTRFSDEDQEFKSLALANSIWVQLTELVDIELQHFFEGNEGELEKETLGLALGLSQGRWHFRLHFSEGDLTLFTRDDLTDFINSLVSNRLQSDISGSGVSLTWQGDAWYWQFNYHDFDYQQDLSRLDQSLFIQFILEPSALAQSSLLISQDTSLVMGIADRDNDYSIGLLQDRSAIDQSEQEYVILSWQHWQSQRLAYLLGASSTVPVDDVGLSLGLRWAL